LSYVEETSGQNTASSSLSRRSNPPLHPPTDDRWGNLEKAGGAARYNSRLWEPRLCKRASIFGQFTNPVSCSSQLWQVDFKWLEQKDLKETDKLSLAEATKRRLA